MDSVSSFFATNGFLPHGYCFTWSPGLLWVMVSADAVIAGAYFSIPLAIARFRLLRPTMQHGNVALLFGAFILACGVTHLMDIWTIWQPDYGLQATTKAITAVISLATAVVLWPLIPRALRLPSVSELQQAVASLQAEVNLRKSTEDRLHQTEQSLSVALDHIEAGFMVVDANGSITGMNGVAERLTGWPLNEARGRFFWDVYRREGGISGIELINPVETMVARGLSVEDARVVTLIARDGTRTPVQARAALTRNDQGDVRGLSLTLRDMSMLREAQTELRRLAAIVESSNDVIISKTLDGRITSWNRAATVMFGYSAEEAIGQPVQMLIPQDRVHEEMMILANLASGQSVPPFDTLRQTKTGELVELSITLSPIRDATGRVVGGAKIARDLSQQRRAAEALRSSEARLRFALDSVQIGEWDMDLATGHIRHSLRYDQCFGYSQPQPGWSFNTLLAHVLEDDRLAVRQSFRDAVSQLKDWHVEARVRWPDGGIHWVNIHGGLLQEAGQAARMLGVVTDITEPKVLEEARTKAQRLEEENRDIQMASRLKSQFLANMSHELRTPLNAIIGFAELLHNGAVPASSPKHREYLGHIATSGHHLLQLINDVLDLSKVESGTFNFVPEPLVLTNAVREASNVLLTLLQRKRLHLDIDVHPDVTHLVLDPARLKQVLYNYLSNAIKFTPEGGRITVRATPEGPDHFRLEVQDTGIGIAPEDLPRLFVEFQQLDTGYSKKHQGTGLGLALTRKLVEAQGGTVGVRSTPGVGSVFHIVLARNLAAAEVLAAGKPPPSLLLMADDPQLHARVVGELSAIGFLVDTAVNAAQAVQQAQQRDYDAISLDLMLPEQGGLAALDDIRSQPVPGNSRVMAMSMPVATGTTASFAIADIISKPLRTGEVAAAMAWLQPPAGRGRLRVLVIDDDPMALALMRSSLDRIQIETVCMSDGRLALDQIETHQPDAIVLDLMMPQFDGFAVLAELQKMPAWRTIPVFIWTSMLLTDDEYASLVQSARSVIGKGGGLLDDVLASIRQRCLEARGAGATREGSPP